jgi:hypothetical protein
MQQHSCANRNVEQHSHQEENMKALSVERSICEGERDVKELFEFVSLKAEELMAYQMEQEIFDRVMQIGLAAMKGYFAAKGTGDVGDELVLPDGTLGTKAEALRGRDYFSVFGKFKVPRTAYQRCGRPSVMPLDAQADLPERCYSYLLQEWMDHLSIRESFQASEGTLTTLLGLHVSASRFEVVNQHSVSQTSYTQFYTEKAIPSAEQEGAIQVLSFDGKGVPMIKREAAQLKARLGKGEKRQKKKEAMVGVSYTIEPSVRHAEDVAERLLSPETAHQNLSQVPETTMTPPKAQQIRRLASLAQPKQQVVEELVRDASARDPQSRRPWVVVMDGALGLWAVVASVLHGIEFVGILDIIHVVEYLWAAGNALHGDSSEAATSWVRHHLVRLLQGHVGRVIGGLKQTRSKRQLTAGQQKALTHAITYFENHRRWMQYDVYLKAGYPIGSGVVESTCGHTVKDRMEGSGRRWSIPGAESTLLLRSIMTSHDWDAYWESHMQQERTRLYGPVLDVLGIADAYHEPMAKKVAGT